MPYSISKRRSAEKHCSRLLGRYKYVFVPKSRIIFVILMIYNHVFSFQYKPYLILINIRYGLYFNISHTFSITDNEVHCIIYVDLETLVSPKHDLRRVSDIHHKQIKPSENGQSICNTIYIICLFQPNASNNLLVILPQADSIRRICKALVSCRVFSVFLEINTF